LIHVQINADRIGAFVVFSHVNEIKVLAVTGLLSFRIVSYATSVSRRSSSGSDSKRLMIWLSLFGYTRRRIYRSFSSCHSERSEAESKNPVKPPYRIASGSLDFARDDV